MGLGCSPVVNAAHVCLGAHHASLLARGPGAVEAGTQAQELECASLRVTKLTLGDAGVDVRYVLERESTFGGLQRMGGWPRLRSRLAAAQ